MADVFRCDHCGQYRPLTDARGSYIFDYETRHDHDARGCRDTCADVVDDVYTVQIACSAYCATAGGSRVGGR